MEEAKINELFLYYKKYIKDESIGILRRTLKEAPDDAYELIANAKVYNPNTVILLSIFLGGLGVDRFYIGDIGVGVAKLIFGWLTFGIWPLIDIFCCYKKAKEKNLSNILINFT